MGKADYFNYFDMRPAKLQHEREVLSGGRTVEVHCPYCQEVTIAHIWSMAGKGKRCDKCGAIHRWIDSWTHAPAHGTHGVCPTCHMVVKLTSAGILRSHGTRKGQCKGSRNMPARTFQI